MSGFLGLGANPGEKQASGNLHNIFNVGLTGFQGDEAAGKSSLDTAKSTFSDAAAYFKNLLTPGRTQATINAAPAVNAATDAADATRRQEAAMGTGRGGGTAAVNREQSTSTAKTTDDIINQSLGMGRSTAATALPAIASGEGSIGSSELTHAAQLLGLGAGSEGMVLNDAQLQAQREAQLGQSLGRLLSVGLFGAA